MVCVFDGGGVVGPGGGERGVHVYDHRCQGDGAGCRDHVERDCRLTFATTKSGLVKGVDKAPDIDPDDIETMFATNVTGLIHMTQACLEIFKRRPDGGAGDIINVGSIAGREGYPGGSIYCATKAAVRTFTDALRRELIATRIRVMEIDPGQVETVGSGCFSPSSTLLRDSSRGDFEADEFVRHEGILARAIRW